jgi:predicted phage terminase large subunit-like protein
VSSLPDNALDLVRAERARRKLIDFTIYTMPDYLAGWFHREVAAKLDVFLADVVARRSPRMMVMAPPRSGKTEIVSRRFPAFAMGKHPDLSVIAASYAADLSSRNNRDVQRVIDQPEYARLFPDTRLNAANIRTVAQGTWLRNSDIFEVVGHKGVYRSAGVGGGITGMGGNILIIDDPIKDGAEAGSQVVRDGIWEWYTSTLYTRRAPGAGILLIMTRWHEDDLAGHILREMEHGGEHWDVVRYPAIAEEDEPHRKKGEPLHPERYPLEDMERTRLAVGSRVWASLYQQRPSAAEGVIFKRDYWRYFHLPEGVTDPQEILRLLNVRRVIQSWDTAHKKKQENDYSACATLGEVEHGYLLLDLWKQKVEYPDLKRAAVAQAAKWRPHVIVVEDKASGQSLIQELLRESRLPVVPVQVDIDKIARANAVTPLLEAGRGMLPENAPWVADFVDSTAAFPNAMHDDDVDAYTQGLNYLARGGGSMGMFEWMRSEYQRTQEAKAAKAAAG